MMKPYRFFPILLLFLLSGPVTAVVGQSDIRLPSGDVQRVSPYDIWPKTLSGSSYNEFWTYQFYLEGDVELTMVYSVANFGSLKSPVSGLRLSVIGFDDNVYQLMREFPVERLQMDRDNWLFRLHPERDIWFQGKLPDEHLVNVQTSKDGVSYDIRLRMSDIQPGYKWGDGKFSVDGSLIGIQTHIPYATVEGYVRINDRERRVRGTVYMDHTFQDKITSRVLSHGYRVVSHNSRDNWEAGYFLVPDSRNQQSVIGYHLVSREGEFSFHRPDRIERLNNQRVFGHSLPETVRISFTDGGTRTITRTEDLERFSLLQELGGLARRLARSYLRGEVVEFRGEASLSNNQRTSTARYNYFIVD